jgi:hypothetical protein
MEKNDCSVNDTYCMRVRGIELCEHKKKKSFASSSQTHEEII